MARENKLRAKFAAGQKCLGVWCMAINTIYTEIIAAAGYDFVILDNEHGPSMPGDTLPHIQLLSHMNVPTVVRVPWNDQVYLKRVLDAGAESVMVPMVETAEQAKAVAEYPEQAWDGVDRRQNSASDYTGPERRSGSFARVDGVREDLLHHDPLLDCLVALTRIHGRPSNHAALTAGLPLPDQGLTPSLFVRAAQRAGFASKLVRRPLEQIDVALLPVILLLKGNEACILLGWEEDGTSAKLLFPDTAQGTVPLSRENLQARYEDNALFARPHLRFDQRTPEVV